MNIKMYVVCNMVWIFCLDLNVLLVLSYVYTVGNVLTVGKMHRDSTFLCGLSPFGAAYMRQWIESALVQIMACRLFGAKPFSKPMLGYRQLDR